MFESVPTSHLKHVHEHIEVKVVDESGCVVPFGTPGELCVRSYSNMLGYWNDEEKTKEMIGTDGWLKTGFVVYYLFITIYFILIIRDLFILEEDGSGKVAGRIKDMIIRGGENISPKEIEEFLVTHPSVVEVQVSYGVFVKGKRINSLCF